MRVGRKMFSSWSCRAEYTTRNLRSAPEYSKLLLCSTRSVMLKNGSKRALLAHFCLQMRKKLRLRALAFGSQKRGSFKLWHRAPVQAPHPCLIVNTYHSTFELK